MKNALVSALFPRRCAVCDKAIQKDMVICDRCRSDIRPITGATCIKCGKPLHDESRLLCYDCSRKIHAFDRGFAIFPYDVIKASLYRFKYSGRAEYARFYARAASLALGDVLRSLKADALVPVPIHRRRRALRGYNQAEELAKELSAYIGVPVAKDYVIRKKSTTALKNLDENARRNNLKGAFIIARNDVKYKTIIVIDDIYTTGSTIDTISTICRASGCEKIYFLTVAIGRGF